MIFDKHAFEKRKQRICIADSEEGGTEVKRFEKPVGGLVGKGPPQAILTLHYDDLLGTRNRHLLTKEFSMKRLKLAGVTDAMFKDAYPDPSLNPSDVVKMQLTAMQHNDASKFQYHIYIFLRFSKNHYMALKGLLKNNSIMISLIKP